MELPFLDALRVDPAKITGYPLSETAGRGKATFFLRLGFRPDDWETLADALKAQARANPAVSVVDSPMASATVLTAPLKPLTTAALAPGTHCLDS